MDAAGKMSRHLELEIYEKAKELFEQENPGQFWRLPFGIYPVTGQEPRELIKRQSYLTRVRDQMHAEGKVLAVRQNFSIES